MQARDGSSASSARSDVGDVQQHHHLRFRIPRQNLPHPRHEYADMATESTAQAIKKPMTARELVSFVKNELDADEERQAKASAASAGELPRESQTGSTLDLSHKNINALPTEVVLLIKDRVERYMRLGGRTMRPSICSG